MRSSGSQKVLTLLLSEPGNGSPFPTPTAISTTTTTKGGGVKKTIVGIAKQHDGADFGVQLGNHLGGLVGDLGALREARQHNARAGALNGHEPHAVGHVLGARVAAPGQVSPCSSPSAQSPTCQMLGRNGEKFGGRRTDVGRIVVDALDGGATQLEQLVEEHWAHIVTHVSCQPTVSFQCNREREKLPLQRGDRERWEGGRGKGTGGRGEYRAQ